MVPQQVLATWFSRRYVSFMTNILSTRTTAQIVFFLQANAGTPATGSSAASGFIIMSTGTAASGNRYQFSILQILTSIISFFINSCCCKNSGAVNIGTGSANLGSSGAMNLGSGTAIGGTGGSVSIVVGHGDTGTSILIIMVDYLS